MSLPHSGSKFPGKLAKCQRQQATLNTLQNTIGLALLGPAKPNKIQFRDASLTAGSDGFKSNIAYRMLA